jgi:hypothetical protein
LVLLKLRMVLGMATVMALVLLLSLLLLLLVPVWQLVLESVKYTNALDITYEKRVGHLRVLL